MKHEMGRKAAVSYLVQHVGDVLDRQLDQVLQEQLGIGISQYKVLSLLTDSEEGQGQRMLAKHLGQTEASVSRQITLLLERGMVSAHINAKNKRQNLVSITPKGGKVADAARLASEHYLESLWPAVSDKQQKQLQDALAVVHAWSCQPGKLTSCDHPFGL
ncbi:MAG: MarR family winged helix-turn-helix transcriptional regulator [Candidatus Saccharibacteria bacterium]